MTGHTFVLLQCLSLPHLFCASLRHFLGRWLRVVSPLGDRCEAKFSRFHSWLSQPVQPTHREHSHCTSHDSFKLYWTCLFRTPYPSRTTSSVLSSLQVLQPSDSPHPDHDAPQPLILRRSQPSPASPHKHRDRAIYRASTIRARMSALVSTWI